jgi:hypothetical protein
MSQSTRKQLEEFIKSSPLNVDKNFTDEPKKVEENNLKSKMTSTILNNSTLNDYDVSEYQPTLSSVAPKSTKNIPSKVVKNVPTKSAKVPQNAPEK